MNRFLIVVTSHETLGETGLPTGVWLPELTHPYFELVSAGWSVDVASPKGGAAPIDPYSDPRSKETINADDLVSMGFLRTPKHRAKLTRTKKLSRVDAADYDGVLFAGGNGAIFDFATDPSVTQTVEAAWRAGKVVATVCHGAAALLAAKRADGRLIVDGEAVTAFDDEEEAFLRQQVGREWAPFTLESELPKRGAHFRKARAFTPHVVVSGGGRLVTGQNNVSGAAVGRAILEVLTRHETPPSCRTQRVAIIGAGSVGHALGAAWTRCGIEVVFGVRRPKEPKAESLSDALGPQGSIDTVARAAGSASVVVLATPWPAAQEALESAGDLRGKVLLDCTNPLLPDLSGLAVPHTTSGAEQIAAWAPGARVVKIFNTTGFDIMANPRYGTQGATMFLCGDDAEAKALAAELAAVVGFDPVDVGPLARARLLEPLALLWIQLAIGQGLGRDIAFRLLRR
jgi:8-hydroxy-5-deazaflavin:NADPH oxidoreductase